MEHINDETMKKTHWKKAFNPNYMGAYSLDPGEELTLTIKATKKEKVKNSDGREDECLVLHWEQSEKPMILNKTNSKAVAKVAGSPYLEDWPGTSIQIYISKVKAFGSTVDALRVRDFKPKGKRKLTDQQFDRMLTAIEQGKLTEKEAVEKYALTPTQLQTLKAPTNA